MDKGKVNTDKEIWRRVKDDFYSPSIFVTKEGGIGIKKGGMVFVKPVEQWHSLAQKVEGLKQQNKKIYEALEEISKEAAVDGKKRIVKIWDRAKQAIATYEEEAR